MSSIAVFLQVSAGALVGMVMGAAFGWAAAAISPAMFLQPPPAPHLDPQGTAIVLGAAFGVLCGGCLAAFALTLQHLREGRKRTEEALQQRADNNRDEP